MAVRFSEDELARRHRGDAILATPGTVFFVRVIIVDS